MSVSSSFPIQRSMLDVQCSSFNLRVQSSAIMPDSIRPPAACNGSVLSRQSCPPRTVNPACPACPIYPVGPVDRTGVESAFSFISSGLNVEPI